MVTVVSKANAKTNTMSSQGGMLWPHLAFFSSAVKITNWNFHELSYPSLALKAFEHSSQLVVNSAFLSGVRRVLLGCSTAHSLGSVIAKGKFVLKLWYSYCSAVPQTHRLLYWSKLPYSQKLHSQEGRTISHCLGESRGREQTVLTSLKRWFGSCAPLSILCFIMICTCSVWDGEEEG